MASERWRLFFALPIPEEVGSSLIRVREELKAIPASKAKSVRWSKLEHLHLTLAFFASVEPHRVPDLCSAAQAAAKLSHTFRLQVRGVGGFPRREAARVIWTGFSPSPQLLGLHGSLVHELEVRGFPREKRDFCPHITLARFREGVSFQSELAGFEGRELGDFLVRELRLYRSCPGVEGSNYDLIYLAPLPVDE